ncbi:MAG: STAS domain-containing protein [Vulcanococcus sp.]
MDLRVDRRSQGVLIHVDGDIDTITAPELQTCLSAELAEQTQTFVIDMSAVRYISSMGLRVLLSHLKRVKAQNGAMVIAGSSKLVSDVFRMSGFASYFEMVDQLSSLDERLGASL